MRYVLIKNTAIAHHIIIFGVAGLVSATPKNETTSHKNEILN
jgi:hypothetical protein